MSSEYKVGYKRPPIATRFKKGQSGNPKGRAKQSRAGSSLAQAAVELFYAEYNRKVPITIQGRIKKMALAQVLNRKLIERAAKGELPAVKLILAYIRDTQNLAEQSAHSQSSYRPRTLAEFYGKTCDGDEPE